MEAARHIRAGDHVEHRLVVTESPHPEALAQIRVEIDGHDDQPTVGAGVAQRFSETNSASGRPNGPFVDLERRAGRGSREPGPGTGSPRARRRRACRAVRRAGSGSKIDTQPMPSPSARAASHRFWIAHDTDARSICGSVRRPNTCACLPSPSATTSSSAHSRIPSTLSARNSSPRGTQARPPCAAARRRPERGCRRRSCGSVMRMNRHGCISPTLGAACAACSSRASTSSGTAASGTKRRISRRSAITR